MEGHAQKCVERCCELANKKAEQLYIVSSPCLDDPHFRKGGACFSWRIIKSMFTICLKMLVLLRELVDPTFNGQSINLLDQSPNGYKAFDELGTAPSRDPTASLLNVGRSTTLFRSAADRRKWGFTNSPRRTSSGARRRCSWRLGNVRRALGRQFR